MLGCAATHYNRRHCVKRVFAIFLGVLLLSLSGYGQTARPRLEVKGGYQLFHRDLGSGGNSNNSGWTTGATAYLSSWLGITADFGGIYDSGTLPPYGPWKSREYQFLFGPTFKYRARRHLEPYGHVLFGVNHETFNIAPSPPIFSGPTTANDFAMALGGGVDVPISRNFAVQAGNVDYFRVRTSNAFHHVRFSTGVQFRF